MARFKVIVRQTVDIEVPVEAETSDAAWETLDPFVVDGDFEVIEAEVVAVSTDEDYA